MIPDSLTRKHERIDGAIYGEYAFSGETIRVFDSAGTALRVFDLFADKDMDGEDKVAELIGLIFPDWEDVLAAHMHDLDELLISVCWDAYGIDISLDKRYKIESGEPAFDWNEDAGRIKASLLAYYGREWVDIANDCTYAQVCDLLKGMIEGGAETPFGRAIYYRTAKPPERTKHNKKEVENFRKLREYFALGKKAGTIEDRAEAVNDMFASVFAAERVKHERKHSNN